MSHLLESFISQQLNDSLVFFLGNSDYRSVFGRIVRSCLRILNPSPVYEIGAVTELADVITKTVIYHKPTSFSIWIATRAF